MTGIAEKAGRARRIGRDVAQLFCIGAFGGHTGCVMVVSWIPLVNREFERACFALRREQLTQFAFEQAGMLQE